jgi:anti-sigma factor (TIGR02949 family)
MNFLRRQDGCGDCRRRLDDYLSGELAAGEAARVREHLDSCASCADESAEARRVRWILRRAVRGEAAPANLARAVRRAIEAA